VVFLYSTVVGLRGKNYAIIGGDTRLSDGGYAVHTRNTTKIHKLTNHCVIASSGQQSERCSLWKTLDHKCLQYKFQNNQEMAAKSVAQTLSNTLYYRRFFPIYTFNVVAGVQDGQGFVFGYDAIGSYESSPYCVTGSGSALITSILDNQVEFKTQPGNKRDLTIEEAVAVFKDSFICAGERDIYTGDSVEYAVITEEGVTFDRFELRKD
jgi:20S proteasome subunit beta 6